MKTTKEKFDKFLDKCNTVEKWKNGNTDLSKYIGCKIKKIKAVDSNGNKVKLPGNSEVNEDGTLVCSDEFKGCVAFESMRNSYFLYRWDKKHILDITGFVYIKRGK